MQDQDGWKLGDKVRISAGSHKGQRGVIAAEKSGSLEVTLANGMQTEFALSEITNFSLAARRAWASMPKQAGRPKSISSRKRLVSIRVDEELWRRLGEAVEHGLLQSRESAVNTLLKDHLEIIEALKKQRLKESD